MVNYEYRNENTVADGAADGFMWGGISAGVTFTTTALKGIKIQKIGRIKPDNKPGDGYLGAGYEIKRGIDRKAYRSIELHSPHKGGPHQMWHWQQNRWSYDETNKIWRISGRAKRWNIWGRRI